MPKKLLLAFLLSCIVDALLCAQYPATDLSGTWKLNLEKSKLPKGRKVQSQTLVITHSGASIQMHYATNGYESTFTYIADGKERKVRELQGGQIVSKAYWKGSVLITETTGRLKLPDQPVFIHRKERWKLSGDGRALTVELDSPKRLSVYDKQ